MGDYESVQFWLHVLFRDEFQPSAVLEHVRQKHYLHVFEQLGLYNKHFGRQVLVRRGKVLHRVNLRVVPLGQLLQGQDRVLYQLQCRHLPSLERAVLMYLVRGWIGKSGITLNTRRGSVALNFEEPASYLSAHHHQDTRWFCFERTVG